jgi:hypothetical protein
LKLAGHRPGLPGDVISFYIVPLDPAQRAVFARHAPVKKEVMKKLSLKKLGPS